MIIQSITLQFFIRYISFSCFIIYSLVHIDRHRFSVHVHSMDHFNRAVYSWSYSTKTNSNTMEFNKVNRNRQFMKITSNLKKVDESVFGLSCHVLKLIFCVYIENVILLTTNKFYLFNLSNSKFLADNTKRFLSAPFAFSTNLKNVLLVNNDFKPIKYRNLIDI